MEDQSNARVAYPENFEKEDGFDPREHIVTAEDLDMPRDPETKELAPVVCYSKRSDNSYVMTPLTYGEMKFYDLFMRDITDLSFEDQAEIINKHLKQPSPEDIAPEGEDEITPDFLQNSMPYDTVLDILTTLLEYSGALVEEDEEDEEEEGGQGEGEGEKKGQEKEVKTSPKNPKSDS